MKKPRPVRVCCTTVKWNKDEAVEISIGRGGDRELFQQPARLKRLIEALEAQLKYLECVREERKK